MRSENNFLKNIFNYLIISVIFLLLALTAFLARSYDYARESMKYSDFTPFTLECAMMYGYSYDIARGGSIPEYDTSLAGMEHIKTSSQMSISLEYFIGYGYRIKEYIRSCLTGTTPSFEPDNLDYNINTGFVDFARTQLRLWISLSAGILFLWLLIFDVSLFYSAMGGLLFAFAPAAIARATGQDMIRENFAIPLILMSFISYYFYVLKAKNNIVLLGLMSAAALSFVSWDMTKLCFTLWALFEMLISFFNDRNAKRKLTAWIAILITAILCGVLNPYLRDHFFITSHLVAIIIPVLICSFFISLSEIKRKYICRIAGLLLFIFIWLIFIKSAVYDGSYSHFLSLLISKISFANQQPLDPSLLDFDSRILWTPALHSAAYSIYRTLFFFIFEVFILLLILNIIFPKSRKALSADNIFPVVLSMFFFVCFVFMVRFHALAIPFICVAVPMLAFKIQSCYPKPIRLILPLLLIVFLLLEVFLLTKMHRRYDEDFKEHMKLIAEFNPASFKGKTLLSDFTFSPMLKAYCGASIVTQPKFEMKRTRDIVERYMTLMFHGSEFEFMEFCREYRVDFVIFDKAIEGGGRVEPFLHPWSSRYIANARILKEDAPVILFSRRSHALKYFYPVDDMNENFRERRFLVYKTVYPEDIIKAEKIYNTIKAEVIPDRKLILEAFMLNPGSPEIRYLYYISNNEQWPQYRIKTDIKG